MRCDQPEHRGTALHTLQEVTDAAAQLFTAPPRWHAAKAYLRRRGIEPERLGSPWIIGYAPPSWTRLVDNLRDRFDDQALLDAGIARRSSRGTIIDTFRNRVIFGIRRSVDDRRVAGFIGRDLSGDPNAPKYLNTPRQPLFDKSTLLFGLHEGMRNAQARQPVVVEGPLDVLAIASRADRAGGDLLPVAPCGTAFTAAHARLVAKVAFSRETPVVVAMDGDTSGRLAALNAGEQLRNLGLDVLIGQLPIGTDPAGYLSRADHTLDPFYAEHGLPLLTVRSQIISANLGERMQWIEGRLAGLRSIAGYLARYPPSYAARQVSWLADALDLAPSTVTGELVNAFVDRRDIKREPTWTRPLCI